MLQLDKWRYFHGENSITFCVLGGFDKQQITSMLRHAYWNKPKGESPKSTNENEIEYVHLFPNFGKRYGYGEPDGIIITNRFVVYVEFELKDPSSDKSDSFFVRQMNKFMLLARDLAADKRKRLRKMFEGEFSFFGKTALRRLFQHLMSSDMRLPCFLAVSQGKRGETHERLVKLLCPFGDKIVGWSNYRSLVRSGKGKRFGLKRVVNDVLGK